MVNEDVKVYLSAYHSEVTGSRMMLVIDNGTVKRKILVDCGYYQEIKYRELNYAQETNPGTIDAILVTHNHIDHTGLLPKVVRDGYNGPIYMTEITNQLLKPFLRDSAMQQEENANYMREKDPDHAYMYEKLYDLNDVDETLKLCVGVEYFQEIEILPNIKVTFLENGHILGAASILVQVFSYNRKPLNFLFSGDYRSRNPLFFVRTIPRWIKKLDLILVTESTYGTTYKDEIKECFKKNMLEAFSKRMHILIGAFAQGRMQEILKRFKIMQDEGLIPAEYEICIDGGLGVTTCFKYSYILEKYYPNAEKFMPREVRVLDSTSRSNLLDEGGPKIVITTSGMLSNGPAREHVPMFLERPNCMIHLCGYAAEETIARDLLDTMHESTVNIHGKNLFKRAIVKTTREFTSHAKADELLDFMKKFHNLKFVVVNHGEENTAKIFSQKAEEELGVPAMRISREKMLCFIQNVRPNDYFGSICVKQMPAKLSSNSVMSKHHNNKKKDARKSHCRKNGSKKR